MKQRSALIIILIFLVSTGCSPARPSVNDIQTAIAETQITIPSATVAPAYTPYPTYTPRPTLEPKVILVTATAPPDFTQIYQFLGSGKGTTDLFSLQTGIIKVTWNYTGTSNFAFYLKRLDTDDEELIENTIGNADGQVILKVGASDQYLFDVMFARGDWTITVFYRP